MIETPDEERERYGREFDEKIGLKTALDPKRAAELKKLFETKAAEPDPEMKVIRESGVTLVTKPFADPPEKPTLPSWMDDIPEIPAEPTKTIHGFDSDGSPVSIDVPKDPVQESAKAALTLVPEFGGVIGRADINELGFALPHQIVAIIEKTGMSEDDAAGVLIYFQNAFLMADSMRQKVEAIEVRDEYDADAMASARDLFYILRDERISIGKKHALIKEVPLRQCQLIDGVKRYLVEDLLKPIETEAKNKAEFAENLAKERKAKLAAQRYDKLQLFEVDKNVFDITGLGDMSTEQFDVLYNGVVASFNEKKAAEALAKAEEAERQRKAEAERLELKKRANEAEEQARIEKGRADIERAAKEKAEKEIADKKLEEKRKESERLAELDRLAKAPDLEKVKAYFDNIMAVEVPQWSSKEIAGEMERFGKDLMFLIERTNGALEEE